LKPAGLAPNSATEDPFRVFDGFQQTRIATTGAEINLRKAGEGPPLLLLHGYPQTLVMWHKIAPALAERFTVVLTDLRGYGDSTKPPGGDNHEAYSKRAMAQDQAEVMAALGFEKFAVAGHDRGARVGHRLALDHALGFEKFAVAGHDRGARVGHRLALDHPDRVTKLALLDIAPTLAMYERADMAFASAYYHWFFLIQPFDLPERLIGADPDYYLEKKIGKWSKNEGAFDAAALAEYKRCFRDPATIHATCEDYRAAAGIDLEHDRADLNRKLACPLLALWGAEGVIERSYDVLEIWRERARDVTGKALPCGHFLAEEAPAETLDALLDFL
jgi:haloacetate dehalogenase